MERISPEIFNYRILSNFVSMLNLTCSQLVNRLSYSPQRTLLIFVLAWSCTSVRAVQT